MTGLDDALKAYAAAVAADDGELDSSRAVQRTQWAVGLLGGTREQMEAAAEAARKGRAA